MQDLYSVTEHIIISYKNRLMHTYIIHIALLALCYSDMFQPLE
jgi:hypothetical protein